MEDERKWEDLETDCLINIFSRVDTETMVGSVHFVCKSWYLATLNPQCWQNLYFRSRAYDDEYIQFCVDRSQRLATSVIIDHNAQMSRKSWLTVAQGFPMLKVLHLPPAPITYLFIEIDQSDEIIRFWKNLECICLPSLNVFREMFESISLYCKKFNRLLIPQSFIEDEAAALIVQYLPKIKVLDMNECYVQSTSIAIILKGCRELEYFDVSNCYGFDEMDDEILKLASHVKSFNCCGSFIL